MRESENQKFQKIHSKEVRQRCSLFGCQLLSFVSVLGARVRLCYCRFCAAHAQHSPAAAIVSTPPSNLLLSIFRRRRHVNMTTTQQEQEEQHDVKNKIHEIRRDLQTLEVNGAVGQLLLGWWLNPLKDLVADPVLGIAETVVPLATSAIPFSDVIVNFGLDLTSHVGHFCHGVGCQVGIFRFDDEKEVPVYSVENRDLAHQLEKSLQEFAADDTAQACVWTIKDERLANAFEKFFSKQTAELLPKRVAEGPRMLWLQVKPTVDTKPTFTVQAMFPRMASPTFTVYKGDAFFSGSGVANTTEQTTTQASSAEHFFQ